MRRKNHNAGSREPLRWRITEWNEKLSIVLLNMASPLKPGESLVWEGAARHMTEAYRLAMTANPLIRKTKEGFKIRRPRCPTPLERPTATPE